MTVEARWYVAVSGDQQGPMTRAEIERRIRSGELAAGAHVYCDGMREWTRIEETDEFGAAFRPVPPPPPPPPAPRAEAPRRESSFVKGQRLGEEAAEVPSRREPSAPRKRAEAKTQRKKLPRRFRRGSLQGTARDVQVREVTSGWGRQSVEYMSFRLELTDASGNVVDEVPVELRGENIPGRVLRDGDTVAVRGRRSRRGLVNPKGVYVVSTKAEIKVKRHGFFTTMLALPLGLAFLASWPALVVGIVGINSGLGWLIPVSLAVMLVYYLIYIR